MHDELIYEVPNEEVPIVASQLKNISESPDLLNGFSDPLKKVFSVILHFITSLLQVALEVKVSRGSSWSSLYRC